LLHAQVPAGVSQDIPTIGNGVSIIAAGSRADQYLRTRGIPLGCAHQMGVRVRYGWPGSDAFTRIVFPLTNPEGTLLNYYGRAVGDCWLGEPPVSSRHRYGRGPKGYWNGCVLARARTAWLCESAFDALSLYSASVVTFDGSSIAISLGGASHFVPRWMAGVRSLICLLDRDEAGRDGYRRIAAWALSCGVRCWDASELLAPYNDVNEYLVNEGSEGLLGRLSELQNALWT